MWPMGNGYKGNYGRISLNTIRGASEVDLQNQVGPEFMEIDVERSVEA